MMMILMKKIKMNLGNLRILIEKNMEMYELQIDTCIKIIQRIIPLPKIDIFVNFGKGGIMVLITAYKFSYI